MKQDQPLQRYEGNRAYPGAIREAMVDAFSKAPSFGESVVDNFYAGMVTDLSAIEAGLNLEKPENEEKSTTAHQALEFIEMKMNRGELTGAQKATRFIPNMIANGIGMMAGAPETMFLGLGAGSVARTAVTAGAKYLPDAITNYTARQLSTTAFGKSLPAFIGKESVGSLVTKSAAVSQEGSAFMLPAEVVEAYDSEKNKFSMNKFANAYVANAGLTLGLAAVPYAAGVVWGKGLGLIRAGKEISPAIPGEATKADYQFLNKALDEGHITPEQHAWYTEYLKDPEDPSLTARATKVLKDLGHPVDVAKNEVYFEVLSPQDVTNLKKGIEDQVFSNIPEKYRNSLSDFVLHNRFDELRESNKKQLDGLRGFVHYMNKRLERKPMEMDKLKRLTDRVLKKNIGREHPLSHDSLYKAHKRGELQAHEVPKSVAQRVRQEDKIKDLQRRNIDGRHDTKISELESKKKPLLHPKEELAEIERKLIKEDGTPDHLLRTKEYHRLKTLAKVSPRAKGLLDRVEHAHEYNRQSVFKDVVQTMTEILDSDASTYAKPQNVINYLKEKIDSGIKKAQYAEVAKKSFEELEEAAKVPTDAEGFINELIGKTSDIKPTDLRNELREAVDRYREFSDKRGVVKSMIDCLIGKAYAAA